MKKRLFIGSSVEGLDVANAVQGLLERDAESTVWHQGIFDVGGTSLHSLIKTAKASDAAVFVFSADDEIKIRGNNHLAVRDNVIFELGLFIGVLGAENVYIVAPRDNSGLRIPTDILGVTYATYDPQRSDGNVDAALGPACTAIRRQLRKDVGEKDFDADVAPRAVGFNDEESVGLIQAWLRRSMMAVLLRPHRHDEVDHELGLSRGTSSRLARRAVEDPSTGWRVVADNGEVFQLEMKKR